MPITDATMAAQRSFTMIRQGGKLRDQGVTSLYRRYAAHFRKFYLYQGLSAADADDIVQEAFVNIVRHCNTYNGDSPLEAWLWRIARNCMNDHFRRTKARPAENLDDDGWDALEQERVEVGKENLDQLRATLTSLRHGAVLLQYLVTETRPHHSDHATGAACP